MPSDSPRSSGPSTPRVLDVRGIPKPRKHPAIFELYQSLDVGESFILINDHDPRHLRDEFDTDHPGGYEWEYLSRQPRDWQITITKRARTPLPRVLVNTGDLPEEAATGAIWSISASRRDLDSNVIWLPPGEEIGAHTGPDLDVLIHVISGGGSLTTELGEVPLTATDVVYLPRQSLRGFTAGPEGLRYLTVHRRRESLGLNPTRR
ncbi:uncharacterized protein (DUF2249 family) [Stackebrandtia endophytica]|uniref:Uncharacterized protein (DUF2249 family) n=1 Tax=Stackebrandtia endophytica TaxID=1496996 RepID=A0A543AS61_9ACTN|nr:DUF2249 domain-containing protein [Stackebrandtia endophytica]TQL75420.1 uncharacterized protein (DUF2249 family) [Stackebrandtia endophytica]